MALDRHRAEFVANSVEQLGLDGAGDGKPLRAVHADEVLATAVGFGGAMVLPISTLVDDVAEVGLYPIVGLLLLPYASYRWASGPEALVGTAIHAAANGDALISPDVTRRRPQPRRGRDVGLRDRARQG